MHIDENAVWQRVAASWEGADGDPLGQALEEARTLLQASAALSTGKDPWPELLGSHRKTVRALRGLGRLLGRETQESPGKKRPLPGKSFREKLMFLLERQEQQARALEMLEGALGEPAARVARQEAQEAWHRWRLLLLELGR